MQETQVTEAETKVLGSETDTEVFANKSKTMTRP